MNPIVDRIVEKLNARRIREGEYRAACPVHRGTSSTSLSIKDAGDRALLHCHGGCDLQDILPAIGLKSVAELFNASRTKPDPEAARLAVSRRQFDVWCERRLSLVSELLRDIEVNIGHCVGVLSRYENGECPRDAAAEERWWHLLSISYRTRTDLEDEFGILNSRDLNPKLRLFAEWRCF